MSSIEQLNAAKGCPNSATFWQIKWYYHVTYYNSTIYKCYIYIIHTVKILNIY